MHSAQGPEGDLEPRSLQWAGGLVVLAPGLPSHPHLGRPHSPSPPSSLLPHAPSLVHPAGLSNIIGVIVYISANAGEPGPKRDDEKKGHYSYGWSFYFGGLSFILAEVIGVLAVNIYIERSREAHGGSRGDPLKAGGGGAGGSGPSAILRLPSYRLRYRRRSRSSSRSSEPPASRDASPPGTGGAGGFASTDISMYTLSRDASKGSVAAVAGTPGGSGGFLTLHNAFPKEATPGGVTVTVTGPPSAPPAAPPAVAPAPPVAPAPGTLSKDAAASNTNTLNRKTTPV